MLLELKWIEKICKNDVNQRHPHMQMKQITSRKSLQIMWLKKYIV